MSREYQLLHEEATAVDWEIQELQESCRVRSAAELATLERRLDGLTVKRASLTKAMILLASVEDPTFGDMQRAFVNKMPHRYHSQGTRSKVVYLAGAVQAAAVLTCFPGHRCSMI
jgi:hypothetical protein